MKTDEADLNKAVERKPSTAAACWVCEPNFMAQRSLRIEQWLRLGNVSTDLSTPSNRKNADDFGLMVYRLRMQNCYGLVTKATPALVKVLKKECRITMPCLSPSQIAHFMGMDGFDYVLMKHVSIAYSKCS